MRDHKYEEIMEAAEEYVTVTNPDCNDPAKAVRIMRPILRGRLQEELWVMILSPSVKCLGIERVTIGLMDRTSAHAREVFRAAILGNAHSIILIHNHPSGDLDPSQNDRDATYKLKEAGEILGIKLRDHIIIGIPGLDETYPKGYLSMSERNLI